MKAIMISIKPRYVALELNGIKNIEVRKNAPKDWKDYLSGKTTKKPKPRTCYIYCTKDKEQLTRGYSSDIKGTKYFIYNDNEAVDYRGKVVAKFTLNKVEEIFVGEENNDYFYKTKHLTNKELRNKSCLSNKEMLDYLNLEQGYAWHISNLVIFDKPKELSEFNKCQLLWSCDYKKCKNCRHLLPLTKAPQSWQFIEV